MYRKKKNNAKGLKFRYANDDETSQFDEPVSNKILKNHIRFLKLIN